MKRNRLIWLGLWIISLIGISFYGGTISYGFCALISVIPVVSFIYLLYVFFFFHMYQKVDSKWLVVDETSPFYFTLVNDYYVLFAGIRVKFYSDFSRIQGLDEQAEYEFFAKSGLTLETDLTCKYRGEYEVGIKTIVITDYFRLFSISYKNREPLKVIVRPKVIHLEKIRNVDVKNAMRSSRYGNEEADVLVRKYEPGDDYRRMHWPLTAQNGELMVRLRNGYEYDGVGVILDTHRVCSDEIKYLAIENKILETILALSFLFCRENIPVFHFQEDFTSSTKMLSSLDGFDEYYDFVSNINFDENIKAEKLYYQMVQNQMLLNCRQVFFVISEYGTGLPELLQTLSLHGVAVKVYVINETIPPEIETVSMARVDVELIKPHDNLLEVM